MKLVEANPVYSKDDELLSMDKEDALMVFETHIRTLEEASSGNWGNGLCREVIPLHEIHVSGDLSSTQL